MTTDMFFDGREPSFIYDCGDNAVMCCYENCNADDYGRCLENISDKGFSLYDSRNIDGNLHSTFSGRGFVHCYYTPADSTIRIITEHRPPSYNTKPVITGRCPVKVWQFEVDHSLIDCGMCYIIQCDDGSFFIIDSAHFYSVNDDIRIIEFLKKMSGEEKPRVSGWFFSHAHDDHINKFTDILRWHSDEITIDTLYYNFPSENHRDAQIWGTSACNMTSAFRQAVDSHPEIKRVKLHTGMHFAVRNLEFDVICTHEDVYPASFADFNDTSVALIMTASGSRVSFPGDCARESNRVITGRYNGFLKCDIVQISHHGHTGLSPEFYRRTGAECALFPVTVIKFDEELPRQEANRTAIEIADEYYIASNGTVEITLPYAKGKAVVYPDETFEDFEGIFRLWCYEYTHDRKAQLYSDFLGRQAKK